MKKGNPRFRMILQGCTVTHASIFNPPDKTDNPKLMQINIKSHRMAEAHAEFDARKQAMINGWEEHDSRLSIHPAARADRI